MHPHTLPPLPLRDWEPSRLYLQLVCQLAGKIRLALHPKMNHWWHAALYISPRGLTTGAIPYGDSMFDLEIDLVDHSVVVRSDDGHRVDVALRPRPFSEVYAETIAALRSLGIHAPIQPIPYKCKSIERFDCDATHRQYDRDAVHRAWSALEQIEPVLKEFRGRFVGKCSPVHMFWHSLDLAVTRFSGRRAPSIPGVDPVTREAYSHEVCSAGFWFGDDDVPEPAFYSYAAPAPAGLYATKLRPHEAFWLELHGAPMAILPYADVRASLDPRGMVLDFMESSYEVAARLGQWDRGALEMGMAA